MTHVFSDFKAMRAEDAAYMIYTAVSVTAVRCHAAVVAGHRSFDAPAGLRLADAGAPR